ncbi:hypothetical protein [Actinomadura rifamycini]|uniref:hypothetical protein n=1 Tax=Actinomadura rifamycini TaxID=31962 RepID=UPI00041D4591|nr:hypothetical protein [Actinomadura rifamycini]
MAGLPMKLLKALLAVVTALAPASLPAVAVAGVLGATAAVTAGCGGGGGEDGDNEQEQDDRNDDEQQDDDDGGY